MFDNTFHIRIKKQYVVDLINDLVNAQAIEIIPEDAITLTEQQKRL